MNEAFKQAQDFLNQLFSHARFDLRAQTAETDSGGLLNLDGEDAALLRAEGGELLDAVEHFVNQAFARGLPQGERIVCDVHSFRAERETELRAMARLAAERVRSSGVPFTFGPMNPNERRVIHLALADDEQLHTESVGDGNDRRLKVTLKSPGKQ
ncbi:MAG TPA: R3H domain-containing nucleic acid-binding protein [Pyrinomonadaceae bacterium]|nr:R3H domain-containing nucleic acid-binding protein [Pyrinomonadaceae bacterium]